MADSWFEKQTARPPTLWVALLLLFAAATTFMINFIDAVHANLEGKALNGGVAIAYVVTTQTLGVAIAATFAMWRAGSFARKHAPAATTARAFNIWFGLMLIVSIPTTGWLGFTGYGVLTTEFGVGAATIPVLSAIAAIAVLTQAWRSGGSELEPEASPTN